jgi:putative oxidoreductase
MPRSLWPILNGGERALLFAFIFAFIGANGGGAFSIDGWWAARRRRQAGG